MAMRSIELILLSFILFSCTEQHDPRKQWALFDKEQATADRPTPLLTEDGKIPPRSTGAETNEDPIEKKYKNFCSSCHGLTGEGNGPAGASLKPPPRNFVAWKEDVTEEYIQKVIREGGAAVGKSPNMAPWGGVLAPDEITLMAKKIKAFRK